MTSQEEASSFRRFFRYVEDSCLRAYDDLVIQNASDISRESDRIRNKTNWTYLQEKKQKKRQGEEIKRTDEEVAGTTETTHSGKHFRMGFMTMPAPQDRLPTPGQGFSVRSQSLNSVGGDDDANNRKQPPPKPKRDPNTKLSSSSEALNGVAMTETQEQDEANFHSGSEDYKKTPPPKPRRNPNTQLSSSFDDTYVCAHVGHKRAPLQWDKPSSPSQHSASGDDAESVYIEMMGNVLRDLKSQEAADDEQNESVYEEMKYPALEDSAVDLDSCVPSHTGSLCHIPQPFPNLLTHRPPLLVFPAAPAQCSPNSDESPLTPVDVTQLSMLEKTTSTKSGEHSRNLKTSEDDRPSTSTITSSGRSSAPPLPSNVYKSSSSSHNGYGYPRSQSACPSPVSIARSLTPLNVKRPPPYDALMAGVNMPVSSQVSTRSQEGGVTHKNSSPYSSMQNLSARLQTPTSPTDESTNTSYSSGKQVARKGSGSRRSRQREGESRSVRPECKDRDSNGRFSPVSSRMGRSSVSPTLMFAGSGESKCVSKLGRSASTSGVSSPGSMPHHPALSKMPWLCGDTTMLEMIEKKRVLCCEIKRRQRPEKNLSKQDSMPILPSWKRKQPPPYLAPPTAASQSSAVAWDTSI
ncbi:neuronal tyrosine-phosphorylated phosphoinositide-3-kinase adapter 2 isoform X1 [Nerophis ophidion]|uniref:neuronal tyrosine-phosphorylated phosphoinositide-3-kinase adapter 2 isoform X1 n=1 Tax=Nerophis ophidion TaxID=159077 RepID=UPI002ADFE7D8|nr:neuronal tyrosine-phosphorylated phosphoinositide-3-kinase adapter 2 isoform X1 [Nerophis ophidion]